MDAGLNLGPWPARLRHSLKQGGRVARRGAPYAVAGLILLGLQRLPLTETLDLLWYDLITTLRPAPSGKEHPISLVGIDDGDIGAFGWPIDDAILCRAIHRITKGQYQEQCPACGRWAIWHCPNGRKAKGST